MASSLLEKWAQAKADLSERLDRVPLLVRLEKKTKLRKRASSYTCTVERGIHGIVHRKDR